MSLWIKKIDVRNFRSLRNITLYPKKLSVLVGKNDSGKSNIIRALNLFFNDSTDPQEDFNFQVDHNVYNQPNRRAKEISVTLEVEIPTTYRGTNGDFIVWEKRWRSDGLVHEAYIGKREVEGPRGGSNLATVEIPDKSNLHTLLRNIRFIYVPAIKDLDYFSELRASIYDVISEVADRQFRESSLEFEHSISHQLVDLTDHITNSLGLHSRLALPQDLSHIFESLDFLSEGHNISLNARGDGIKARHIPLILKFMADKKRSLQVRGSQPYNYIWGYEEPENNLEIASCVELADQFWNFLDDGISQIFLTTHSPVFYNLHRKQNADQISCHHLFKEFDENGTTEVKQHSDLDERMGTTALFGTLVTELEDRVRQREEARLAVEALAAANRRKLFVEGLSDRAILEKAIQVFARDHAADIDIETIDSAGMNYVVDMLTSWRSKAKHNPELPRAAGLLDSDEAAQKAAADWNRVPGNCDSAKCFKLKTPPHIIPIFQAGFKIPVVLETLYDRDEWEWADNRGHLTIRDMRDVIPAELSNRIFNNETTLNDNLDDDWAIFVRKTFRPERKVRMARRIARYDDGEFRARFPFLEALVVDIVSYLFRQRQTANEDENADGQLG